MAELLKLMQQLFAEGASTDGQGSYTQLAGVLGAGTAVTAVVSLVLARYWQAALYNPGGFGEEFRALYYPVWASTAMVLAGLALVSFGARLYTWAMICFIPLSVAGLALVHAWARRRQRGSGWLTGFYIAWLLLEPLKLLVMFFAIADSWVGFRQRWAERDGKLPDPSGRKPEQSGPDDEDDTDERDL